jgi:hypothetical protein
MRAACLVGISLLGLGSTWALAETETPHELVSGDRGLDVRSGPGRQFYSTDRLAAGTTIEVYGREGGWLAIRPPDGSYSWVRKSQLQATSTEGVAKVTEAGAVCRIGSRVVRTPEHICQVRLKQGELVEVLEEQTATDSKTGDADEVWCRIAPPAGEFRWVWAEDVSSTSTARAVTTPVTGATPAASSPPTQNAAQPASGTSASWHLRPLPDRPTAPDATPVRDTQPDGAASKPEVVEFVPASKSSSSSGTAAASLAAKSGDAGAAGAASTPAEMQVRIPPESDPPLVASKTTRPSAVAKPSSAPAAGASASSAAAVQKPAPSAPTWIARDLGVNEDLSQLELELAKMVSQEPRAWRLDPLRQRVEAVRDRLVLETDKAAAEKLLKRIREFADLENRLVQAGIDFPAAPSVMPGGTVAPTVAASPDARFDGTGWLVSVHSATKTAPPYALLNAEGDVLQYVSPAPGLNLHRYERKQVGIYGQRRQLGTVAKPHLTAERIVDLDRHLR